MTNPLMEKDHIYDPQCTRVIVLSDLHKYSGVSNFSKGYDPYFEAYYKLYHDRNLGDLDAPIEELSKKQKRQVEARVRQCCTAEEIAAGIDGIHWLDAIKLRKKYDPNGLWERRQELFTSLKNAQRVVLNGDIFDIQCSTQPPEKIIESVEWLKKRMDSAPHTLFHFVLGNHEAYPEFIAAMHALEEDPHYGKQFSFHEHFVQINRSLFVHGDEFLDPGKYRDALQKSALSQLPEYQMRAYEDLGGVVHAWENWSTGRRNIVKKLYEGLKQSTLRGLPYALEGTTHVFFGHTHDPCAVRHEGINFFNTGSGVKGLLCPFKPLEIIMRDGETVGVNALLAADRAKEPKLIIDDPGKPVENPMSFQNLLNSEKRTSIRKWGL